MQNISELKANNKITLKNIIDAHQTEGFNSVKNIVLNSVDNFKIDNVKELIIKDIENAQNFSSLIKALELMQDIDINIRIKQQLKNNKLAYILDYTSGSSSDGTHYRTIKVSPVNGDDTSLTDMKIRVSNDYMGHSIDSIFTSRELFELNATDLIKHTRYYNDYLIKSESILKPINLAYVSELSLNNFNAKKDKIKKRRTPRIGFNK